MKFKISYLNVVTGIILLSFFSSCTKESGESEWPESVKLATFNIEYDNKNNTDNPWSNRKHLVQKTFDKYKFDMVGIQEPYTSQIEDMKELLPDYGYVGTTVTGNNASSKVLTVGIFYKKDRFIIEEWDEFWLSETPNIPSKGWDAEQFRVCVWALVKDKETGQKFYFFSTHLSFAGLESRNESIKLLIDTIPTISGEYPSVLVGDFNLDQFSRDYGLLSSSNVFDDSFTITDNRINVEQGTYNSYSLKYSHSRRIDHVFIAKNEHPLKVNSWAILHDVFDGKLSSDHNPLMIELSF